MAERILVVEDEGPIRTIIVSLLKTAGYECQEAGNGLGAIAVLESGKEFDLVLSSLMMPSLDGMGLLEHITDKYPDTQFVMMSAAHDARVVLRAIRNGAYDYLLKPFERQQLLNTIRRALEKRRLRSPEGRSHAE